MAIKYACTCKDCGRSLTFTDIDLKRVDETKKAVLFKKIGGVLTTTGSYSVGDAVIGHHIMSDAHSMEGQIVNFERCPYCNSMDYDVSTSEFTPGINAIRGETEGEGIVVTGEDSKSKIVAGALAIFLGGLGVHKFYLGYTKEGLIMLATFFLGGFLLAIPSLVMAVIGVIEGFKYLTMDAMAFQ